MSMSGSDEEWVKSAMSDDAMVVELLVRLHHTTLPPPHPLALKPLEWSVRQRRSKSIPDNNSRKQAPRDSPTTPLSWSAAPSVSGGSGGGYEDSSRPPHLNLSDTTRSKVNGDGEKTASKRSRKKKTFPELKEEEKLLVKERRELKRELTAMRMNLDKQKSTNERLKRIKLQLQPNSCKPLILLSNDIEVQPSNASDQKFTLPDLNMPFDDPSSDVICRVG